MRRSQDTVKNSQAKPWLWLCVWWERTFLHCSLIVKSKKNITELVTRPWPIGRGGKATLSSTPRGETSLDKTICSTWWWLEPPGVTQWCWRPTRKTWTRVWSLTQSFLFHDRKTASNYRLFFARLKKIRLRQSARVFEAKPKKKPRHPLETARNLKRETFLLNVV